MMHAFWQQCPMRISSVTHELEAIAEEAETMPVQHQTY